jgi:hypothetical protein
LVGCPRCSEWKLGEPDGIQLAGYFFSVEGNWHEIRLAGGLQKNSVTRETDCAAMAFILNVTM